jgi:uncharacterized protein YlzI (FlbEa/FlbD family)
MIKLTLKPTGKLMATNPKMIGAIITTSDGVVLTITGREYLVKESFDEVMGLIDTYKCEQSEYFKQISEYLIGAKE